MSGSRTGYSSSSRRDGDSAAIGDIGLGFRGGPPASEEKVHH